MRGATRAPAGGAGRTGPARSGGPARPPGGGGRGAGRAVSARAGRWGGAEERTWRDAWREDATARAMVGELAREVAEAHYAEGEALPRLLGDGAALAEAVIELTDVLGLPTPARAVQLARECPELLALPADELARRMLRLKALLPRANVAALLMLNPALLAEEAAPEAMEKALRTMLKLMPGIPIEEQLSQGGAQYRTFVDLVLAEMPLSVRVRSGKQKRALKESLERR